MIPALSFMSGVGIAQHSSPDEQMARKYFEDAQDASRRDHGLLWKQELYGPILFVDPETRAVVANQPDGQGKLEQHGNVYAGRLPREINVANTAVHWAGVDWTMVVWPLPKLRQARVRLLMHECFHRIAPTIGLSPADSLPNHLETRDGRIWLQMEWRSLERALWSKNRVRKRLVEDALYFRVFRRSVFPGAATAENALELNEGLAEYTGVKLSVSSLEEFMFVEDAALREAPMSRPSFVRSFAYVSGPAYGLLLDLAGANWRPGLTLQSDLGVLLAHAYKIAYPEPKAAEALRRARSYDGDEVIAIETQQDQERRARLAAAQKAFIDGPVLVLPVDGQFNYGFDPNRVLAVDQNSTLYQGGQVSDAWGVLQPERGFLIVRNGNSVVRTQVPAPIDIRAHPLKGEGWTLDLKQGWILTPGPRPGDFTLTRQGAP